MRAALPLALAWTLAAPVLSAQQTVIRSTVVGVRLVVRVTDGPRPVTGLTPTDFAVADAGVEQHVDAAAIASHLSVALVVDTSLSMRRGTFATALGSAGHALAALGAGDECAVVAVSDHTTVIQPETADSEALQASLGRVRSEPIGFTAQTDLFDGLLLAASTVTSTSGVPVVLAITDGKDNTSWLPRSDVARILARLGVMVDVVGVSTTGTVLVVGSDNSPTGPPQFPSDITHDSGGAYFDATDKNLGAKLKARFDELRSSYVLTYTPRGVKTDDGWHAVTVRVPNRHVTVKAQAGYFAGK